MSEEGIKGLTLVMEGMMFAAMVMMPVVEDKDYLPMFGQFSQLLKQYLRSDLNQGLPSDPEKQQDQHHLLIQGTQ